SQAEGGRLGNIRLIGQDPLWGLSRHPKVRLQGISPVLYHLLSYRLIYASTILSGLAPVEAFQLFGRARKRSKKLVNVQAWDEASLLQLCQPDQVLFRPEILQPNPQELASKRRKQKSVKAKVGSGKTRVPVLRPKSATEEVNELTVLKAAALPSKVEKRTRKRQMRTVHESISSVKQADI
ncbi:hypothetical protein IFM47457_10762, partial [Aspergillus lentulus]